MSEETRKRQDEAESRALIERLQAGQVDAFEGLFERYSPRIYRQAMQLLDNEAEAEEIMQEVFLSLYENAKTFRGDASVSTWLYRLAANAAISRLRRRARQIEVPLEADAPPLGDDNHPHERAVTDGSLDIERAMLREESRQQLRAAIELLRPTDKAVVVLVDLEELPQRETAEILGLSLAAVKARLRRARLFLRSRLAASLDRPSQ